MPLEVFCAGNNAIPHILRRLKILTFSAVELSHPGHIFCGARRLYIFVPRETSAFAIGFRTPDNHGAITIFDPSGEVVLQEQGNFVTGAEFVVTPAAESTGRIWSCAIRRCEDATGIYLLGVPPYLSQLPDRLLIPREVGP